MRSLECFLGVMAYAGSEEALDLLAQMATVASCEEGWSHSDLHNFDLAATQRREAIAANHKARGGTGHPHGPTSIPAAPRRSRPEKTAGVRLPDERH